jgi:hypothetical protein
VSVQQESSEQIGSAVPTQRTEATKPPAGHPVQDETVVLPAFVTGKKEREPKPAEPVRHQAQSEGALPPNERGMLIFVAALLGVGTLAVVTVLGLGGFSSPRAARTPSVAAGAPPSATDPPSPSPTPVTSSPVPAPPPPPSPTPPPRRTSPARVTLGALTRGDPAAFCTYSGAGRARQREDGSWFCSGGNSRPPFAFAPGDVCQWRYIDKTAFAVVGDATDPATWTCYT